MLRHLHDNIATYLIYIAASFNAPSVNVVCNLQSDYLKIICMFWKITY